MVMGGRLLLLFAPRILGHAAAFAPLHARAPSLPRQSIPGGKLFSSFSGGSGSSNMADEVQAAKAAAEAYKSSDQDGAGPATAFDNILSGKWPSTKVHEDDVALAFRDIQPQAPVHIVVIPKIRDGLTKLSNARDDQKDVLGHLLWVAQKVGKEECPDGFRVVINDGEHGAQSVYHLHLHVLGGRQMGWPPG
ncbi:hypothetical protein ACHAXT_009922 [Thalassiosira profunda]